MTGFLYNGIQSPKKYHCQFKDGSLDLESLFYLRNHQKQKGDQETTVQNTVSIKPGDIWKPKFWSRWEVSENSDNGEHCRENGSYRLRISEYFYGEHFCSKSLNICLQYQKKVCTSTRQTRMIPVLFWEVGNWMTDYRWKK